jgi:hypothetical protein
VFVNDGAADPGDPTGVRVISTVSLDLMFVTLKFRKVTVVPVTVGALGDVETTTGHGPSGIVTFMVSAASPLLKVAVIATVLVGLVGFGLGLPLTQFTGLDGLLELNFTIAVAFPNPLDTVKSALEDVIVLNVTPDLTVAKLTSYLSFATS